MTQKLLDALSKLDPKNDNHWTAEGAPRIETLRILASDSTLTRDDVNKAANDFTRDTATIAAASALAAANPVPLAPVAKGAVAETAPVKADGTPVAQPIAQLPKETVAVTELQNETSAEALEDDIAGLTKYLENLYQDRHDIDVQIEKAQRMSDLLLSQREKDGTLQTEAERSQVAIQGYLAAQLKQRELQAEAVAANPAPRSVVAPIDQALANRSRTAKR